MKGFKVISALCAMLLVEGIREGRMRPDFRLLSAMVDYITQVPESSRSTHDDPI